MSQYPPQPPFQPPSPYQAPNAQLQYAAYGAPPDPLAPAKRASILMWVIGPLMLLCGSCIAGTGALFDSLPPESTRQITDKLRSVTAVSPGILLLITGSLILLPGLGMIVLAFFVRKGSKTAAIISVVLTALIAMKSILQLPGELLHIADPGVIVALFVDLISLGILGLLIYWLFQAMKASANLKLAQQQYMAQYHQYQQNMQAYSGYGYAPQQQTQSFGGYPTQAAMNQTPTQTPPASSPPPSNPTPPPLPPAE